MSVSLKFEILLNNKRSHILATETRNDVPLQFNYEYVVILPKHFRLRNWKCSIHCQHKDRQA